MPDNFSPYVNATTLEGATQTIAEGPVASQEIIKELGTNGGGFMNANSAHPYENPTPLTNLIEMLAIFSIGAGLTHTFGKMVGDRRQGWALFAVMAILFFAGAAPAIWAEQRGNPQFSAIGIDQHASAAQSGGNMEGKEVRFGIVESAMWATVTTDTSCGAVNSMHDSYTPLGGLVPMVNMQLGEVIFGGVGSGLYGIIVMAVLAVFIAGLMVGRTPEYLGKKIEAREMKLAMLYVLIFPAVILIPTAIAAVIPAGLSSISNPGPHGFSQILYAYTEAGANNGSAFGGLNANVPFYNVTMAIRDAARQVHDGDPGACDRRLGRGQENHRRQRRHFPDRRRPVRVPADWRNRDRRRVDVLLRRRTRTDRRATADDVRETLLGLVFQP